MAISKRCLHKIYITYFLLSLLLFFIYKVQKYKISIKSWGGFQGKRGKLFENMKNRISYNRNSLVKFWQKRPGNYTLKRCLCGSPTWPPRDPPPKIESGRSHMLWCGVWLFRFVGVLTLQYVVCTIENITPYRLNNVLQWVIMVTSGH